MASRQPLRALHAPGLLARARLVERITLSPEGSDLGAMCRLARALLAQGTRILTLSYHSPSMEPGNTPYVRTERDLSVFIDRVSGFLAFWRDEVGGEFLSIEKLHRRLVGAAAMAAAHAPSPDIRTRLRLRPPAGRTRVLGAARGRGARPLPRRRQHVPADPWRLGGRLSTASGGSGTAGFPCWRRARTTGPAW